jgi:hypothetical protein
MSEKIDQVFDLLEKVYIEIKDTKFELKNDIQRIENDVHKLQVVVENEIKPDIKTLYELQLQTNKKLEEHDKRFDTIENKIDVLSAKSLRHSYDIGALKRRDRKGI